VTLKRIRAASPDISVGSPSPLWGIRADPKGQIAERFEAKKGTAVRRWVGGAMFAEQVRSPLRDPPLIESFAVSLLITPTHQASPGSPSPQGGGRVLTATILSVATSHRFARIAHEIMLARPASGAARYRRSPLPRRLR